MGQALMVLLVGSLIGMGGVVDDPATTLEDPVSLDEGTVQAAGTQADADVSPAADTRLTADASTSSATLDTGLARTTVYTSVLEEHVENRLEAMGVQIPRLDPAIGPVTVSLDASPSRDDERAPGDLVLASAKATPAPASPGRGALVAPLASALAMTTLAAAVHVEPSLRGWRRFLPMAPLAPLYSRISREDVLDHDLREAVYNLLRTRPGLSLQEIADTVDGSRSTVRHHVRVLEDNDMVEHTTRGRCRIHYPVGRRAEAIRRHLLTNENRARIARAIRQEPRSLTELAEALDENAGAVHFHLKKLCEAGLVTRYENGSVTYKPGEAIREGTEFEPVER